MLQPGKVKIAVATIVKTHGIKGELNIALTEMAEPDLDFAPGSCLIIEINGLDVPFFVAASRQRGADSMLLTLDDVGSDAAASALVGQRLYVYADPDEAEQLTAGHLVGYTLVNAADSSPIGRIDDLTELTPGAWYFNVAGRLIPAVDDFITGINPSDLTVEVELPAGLLDL